MSRGCEKSVQTFLHAFGSAALLTSRAGCAMLFHEGSFAAWVTPLGLEVLVPPD
jgi:hypothetical protein